MPTTAPVPCRAHAARCASVPSGRVKSISTSAARTAASTSVPTITPVARPKRSPASRPDARAAGDVERRGERAAPDRRGRPRSAPAPSGRRRRRSRSASPTRHFCLKMSRMLSHHERWSPHCTSPAVRRRGFAVELGDRRRHFVAFPARELVVDEIDGERCGARRTTALPRELVRRSPSGCRGTTLTTSGVPSSCRTCGLRLADLELVDHVLRQVVALVDVELVDAERAQRRRIGVDRRAAGGEQRRPRRSRARRSDAPMRAEGWRKSTHLPVNRDGRIGYYSCRASPGRAPAAACASPPHRAPSPGARPMTSPHDLKNAGLKATVPRLKIINLFEASKVRHLTAEDVYRQAPGRRPRHRPRHGLSRADAVRAGGPSHPPSFRVRQGGVRAERGPAPRPSRLPAMRARRGVLRRRDREAAERRSRSERGFKITEHALYLYAECVKPRCPYRKTRPRRTDALQRLVRRRARQALGSPGAPPDRPRRRGGRNRPGGSPAATARRNRRPRPRRTRHARRPTFAHSVAGEPERRRAARASSSTAASTNSATTSFETNRSQPGCGT